MCSIKIKRALARMLLPVIWCTSLPSTAYADYGVNYGVAHKGGSGTIRYYTEGFTVHRINFDGTAKEFNDQYGQYLTDVHTDVQTITGATGVDGVFGKADYDNYSIVPFREGKTSVTKAGLAYVGINFEADNYMGMALKKQDGELWNDFFMEKTIEYDSDGNVITPPVMMECNGIIAMLSYDGAIRDQYSLQSPEDGTWFLGGVNEVQSIFYGHQYTLNDEMIPAEPTSNSGGVYYNKDGLTSEEYKKNSTLLMTHLGKNKYEFDARMHLRYAKSYYPILGTTPDGGGGDEEDTLTVYWEETGEYGRDWPEAYTYNTSDEFNLGEGIPSGESYTNGFLTNKWFGKYGWGKTNTVTKTYKVSHHINAKYEYWVDGDDEEPGYWATSYYSVTPVLTTTRQAYYYGVRSADIYEFKDADVNNDSYGIPPHYDNPWSVPVTLNINESAVSTYEPQYTTELDKHVTFHPSSNTVTGWTPGYTVDTGTEEWGWADFVEYFDLQYKDDTSTDIYVEAHNDSLSINDKVYMDPETHSSHTSGESPEMEAPKAISIMNIARNNDSGGDFKCVYDETNVEIPIGVRNGKYTTSFTSRYTRRTPEDNQLFTIDKSGKEGIFNGYKNNEPVVVHTPVISPVKITDPETETQLISQPASSLVTGETLYKLRLDGTYTLEFQPAQWFSHEFGELLGYENDAMTADRYDRYVKQKLVKFPFPVTIVWPSGNRKYCALASGGYTDWIKFPDDVNTLQFYVPSWVTENHSLFGNDTSNMSNAYDIKFRVEAQNVEGDTGEDDSEEEELNSLLENHVATYDIYANVSGVIYGFEIVGINDKDMFKGYSDDVNDTTNYSFALNLEEKKASTKNRFGKPYQRYTLTGEVTDKWDERDTLPLRPGSSHRYSSMGTIWRGSKISFRLKTIANLADATDEIEIKPTFRYIDKTTGAVTEQDDLRIYYNDKNGNYIEYGKGKDNYDDERNKKYRKKVQLNDEQFQGSWYQGGENNTSMNILSFLSDDLRAQLITKHGNDFVDKIKDDLLFTAGNSASQRKSYLNREHESYTLSKIVLDPGMRIYSGNPEEFENNQHLQRTDSYFDWGNYMIKWDDPASSVGVTPEVFRKSMQTWYGQYQVPDQIFVCKKRIDINEDGTTSILDSVRGQSGYSSGDDVNNDGIVNLEDYALMGNLATDSPIWLKTGYLVLNFDIKSINNGVEHLRYGGVPTSGQLNMWGSNHEDQVDTVKLESSETTEQTPSADNPMGNPGHGKLTYTVKDGDIAIVSINEKLSDKYSPRIFMIN